MAKLSVSIPDGLLATAMSSQIQRGAPKSEWPSVSSVVQAGLCALIEAGGRDKVSGRGHTETLRAARAARVALDDLERVLTQEKPVRRRVRRYPG